MSHLALLPRALGALFYYPPSEKCNQGSLAHLDSLVFSYQWDDSDAVDTLVDSLKKHRDSASNHTFSRLFEGQGEMVAPPWGSVYLNADNLLMGESTLAYQRFLRRVGVDFELKNQPLDHFGLMMWALALLIEENNQTAVIELLTCHLLPWSERYLDLLASNQDSRFYADLASLTALFLNQISTDIGISVKPAQLYK